MPVMVDAVPVVFWLNVGQVNVPDEKFPETGVPKIALVSIGEVSDKPDKVV